MSNKLSARKTITSTKAVVKCIQCLEIFNNTHAGISVVLASSSPPSTVVAHFTVGRVIQPSGAPVSLWGINGMGQSRH